MVLERVLGDTARRRLFRGLSVCIVVVLVTSTLRNAAKLQFIGSKQLGFGEEPVVEPNKTDGHGHGHDSQEVDIDSTMRKSPSQATVVVDDLLSPSQATVVVDDPLSLSQATVVVDDPLKAAYYTPGNSTRGNSSLPHTSGLRVAVETVDPSLLKNPSQAAILDDPRAAHYPPGISTRGNSSLPHISGLRVALVGDSLTRYMYLSLAAYLRRGRWVDEKDVPNILEEKQFVGWNQFYNYTNNYFQPNEQCDCYRPEKAVRKTIENRYFVDPVRDNALYFFQKFGAIKASGHWSHEDVHSKHNMSGGWIAPTWSYNWTSLITEHISKLRPKPKYLVFNAGLWPHDLGEAEVRQSIEEALNATNIVGIYKTTSFPSKKVANPATYKDGHHDADVCKSMQNRCIDVSWTSNTSGPLHYWDGVHFKSHIYTAMNMQLLNLLDELQ